MDIKKRRGKDKASTEDMERVIFVHGLDENNRPTIADWPDFGTEADRKEKLTQKAEGRGLAKKEG
jgi:hypothetical protein